MEYLIVIDFEANCVKDGYLYNQEITEFPAVPVCIKTQKILDKKIFHNYCKIDEKLTKFATELTGITQEMCDNGLPFKDVFKLFNKWCYENNFTKENSIIVTCGDWDFKTAFPNQCEYSEIKVPNYCKKWINVKKIFEKTLNKKSGSMPNMLNELNLPLNGKHHSGIDDSKNIAKICIELLKMNADF